MFRACTLVVALVLLPAWACIGYTPLEPLMRNVTVLEQAPPRDADPELQLAPYVPPDSRPVIQMSMRIGEWASVGLPQGELMQEAKRTAAEAGATMLVFDCGPPGTAGQGECTAIGYAPVRADVAQ